MYVLDSHMMLRMSNPSFPAFHLSNFTCRVPMYVWPFAKRMEGKKLKSPSHRQMPLCGKEFS